MVDVEHPLAGPQRHIGPIVELSKTPTAVAGPAPLLGADTDAILRETGYTADEIAGLRLDAVVA